MRTIKLYDEDAYLTECQATVVEVERQEDGATVLVLDQTVFFPEEGGQSCDLGTINGVNVLQAAIREDKIFHTVKGNFAEGDKVQCCIDWAHRFSNMQQHSGEHIYSGMAHNRYGCTNVGFHLSDQTVTMDFDRALTKEQIYGLETAVNEIICQNKTITAKYYTKEEVQQAVYRSKKELEGPVRLVTIEGVDCCACCAPHVAKTGEIGLLKVIDFMNYKGGVRIFILCGSRALLYIREQMERLSDLGHLTNANQEGLVEAVKRLQDRLQKANRELAEQKTCALRKKLEELSEEKQMLVYYEEGFEMTQLRILVNEWMERKDGICALFTGDGVKGYSFLMGSRTVDCRSVLENMKESAGAKGGGISRMVQGQVLELEKAIHWLNMNCQ